MNVAAHGFEVVIADSVHPGNVVVADKLAALPVVSRREWLDLDAQPNQILRLAGKDDDAFFVVTVKQQTDADGVAGGDELPRSPVVGRMLSSGALD